MNIGMVVDHFSVFQKANKETRRIEISKKKQYRAILDVEIVSTETLNSKFVDGEYEPGHDENPTSRNNPYRCDVALLMEHTKSVLIKSVRDFEPDM